MTYLLGLYTPLDPPEVEVIRGEVDEEEVEEEAAAAAEGDERRQLRVSKQCF